MFPGKWAVFPVPGAVLIICAGSDAWINRRILSSWFLVWFGLISFPLYLWHWPIITFMHTIDDGAVSVTARIGAIILSVLLAWLTYLFIEEPLRFKGNGRAIIIILVLLMFIPGLGGYYTYLNGGSGIRNQERSADIINIIASPSRPVTQYDCGKQISELKSYKFKLGCSLSKESVLPTIAFIGDSHMEHYKSAVWDQFCDESLFSINEASCFPFSSVFFMSKTDCRKNGSSQT